MTVVHTVVCTLLLVLCLQFVRRLAGLVADAKRSSGGSSDAALQVQRMVIASANFHKLFSVSAGVTGVVP